MICRRNVHCGGTRDIAAVWANTAEDELVELYKE